MGYGVAADHDIRGDLHSAGLGVEQVKRQVGGPIVQPSRFFELALVGDGKLIATGSNDKTIGLWEAGTGKLLHKLKGHKGIVQSVVFSPDGRRIVSSGFDQLIKMWEVASGKLVLTFVGHKGGVPGIAFSPGGQWFVSASNDGTLRIWTAGPTD